MSAEEASASASTIAIRFKAVRDTLPADLARRFHRALSWLKRSKEEVDDPDVCFILLWIAFNTYAHKTDIDAPISERDPFAPFFSKLAKHDTERQNHDLIWTRFPQKIRLLLMNQFVFAPFWAHQNRRSGHADWEERFIKSRRAANTALVSKQTVTVFSILFDRLHMLSNQLVHGGGASSSTINWRQVRDGAAILGARLPRFLQVMINTNDADWGTAYFPVVHS